MENWFLSVEHWLFYEHWNFIMGLSIGTAAQLIVRFVWGTRKRFEKLELNNIALRSALETARKDAVKLEQVLAKYGDLRIVQAVLEATHDGIAREMCEARLGGAPYREAATGLPEAHIEGTLSPTGPTGATEATGPTGNTRCRSTDSKGPEIVIVDTGPSRSLAEILADPPKLKLEKAK